MKKLILAIIMVFSLAAPSAYADNVFYKSAMHLVASVPDNMNIERNDADNLQLSNPDKGFSVFAIYYSLKQYNRKNLLDCMYELAKETDVDLSHATYTNIDTKSLHGLIASATLENGSIVSYAVVDNGEHAYVIQIAARTAYHHLLKRYFETLEYYE